MANEYLGAVKGLSDAVTQSFKVAKDKAAAAVEEAKENQKGKLTDEQQKLVDAAEAMVDEVLKVTALEGAALVMDKAGITGEQVKAVAGLIKEPVVVEKPAKKSSKK